MQFSIKLTASILRRYFLQVSHTGWHGWTRQNPLNETNSHNNKTRQLERKNCHLKARINAWMKKLLSEFNLANISDGSCLFWSSADRLKQNAVSQTASLNEMKLLEQNETAWTEETSIEMKKSQVEQNFPKLTLKNLTLNDYCMQKNSLTVEAICIGLCGTKCSLSSIHSTVLILLIFVKLSIGTSTCFTRRRRTRGCQKLTLHKNSAVKIIFTSSRKTRDASRDLAVTCPPLMQYSN